MHRAAYAFVRQVTETRLRPAGLVVEIGGRDINGSVRSLFGAPYVSVDIAPGPGVDVVADGAAYAPLEQAACVVCCEVLEHAVAAQAILANAERILQPGGLLIVTAAGVGRKAHSAVDGGELRDGEWYANVERTDLQHWLSGFQDVAIVTNPTDGDIYATAVKP